MVKRLQKSAIMAAIVTLCLLFAAVLILALVPAPRKAHAENEPSVWNGDLAAAGWADTEGSTTPAPEGYVINTEAKTLKIGSAAAFAYFSHQVFIDNTAHSLDDYTVTLTVDIDLNNKTWIPIGTTKRSNEPTRRFSGTFDGNGHTIKNFTSAGYYNNIKYSAADGYYVDVNGDDSIKVPFENDGGEFAFGLFGVTANMTVNNLTMSNVRFDLAGKEVGSVTLIPDNVGAIIGHNSGSLTVENCVSGQQNADGTADSTIKITSNGNPAIGGLVGRAYGIKQTGSATATTYETVKVLNCKNYIDFDYTVVVIPDATSDQYGKVSGILGYSTSYKELKFDHCVNYGNIDGGQIVGGIMAFFTDNSKKTVYENAAERDDNAWNLIIDDCVNYGNITSSNLDTEQGFKTGVTYAGGIMADLAPSGDNSASAVSSSNANYGKLSAVNFYIRRCRNYGTIQTYNTGASNGTNRAGGIIANFIPSETGENRIIDNYNYGNVESIDEKDNITPRMGGYLGLLSFYTSGTNLSTRKVDLDLTGGSSGLVAGGSYDGTRVNSLIGDMLTYPSKPCNIALVDANDYSKNIYRVKEASSEEKPATVTVGADVTEISAGQYLGQTQLTEVNFAENSTLTKIAEWAFAGTGLTQIYLPETVTEIGEYAFGSNVLVIANDKAHYDELMASDNVSDDIKELLTYVITVEYCYLETPIDTVLKLRGKEYAWACGEGGKWEKLNAEDVALGTTETGVANWYNTAIGTSPLHVSDVTALLDTDIEKLVLVTYTSDTKVFYARENIVYDGTAYGMTELNPLLQAAGDRILPSMAATIEAYTDSDGNEAAGDDLPTVIQDAGTYTVRVVEGEKDYGTFEIKVSRATLDLGNYNNLSWRLTAIGLSAANAELLNGNGMTLYIYTDKDGKEYPSTTLLTADQITELDLKNNGAYATKTVLYSAVRNRNKNVTITVAPNSRYTVGLYGNNVGNKVGAYTSTVELTASKNYKFIATSVSTQRGLTISVTDGKTATVTKKWYIVDMSNWLVSANGGEYSIKDRVYGETTAVAAPSLQYGASSAISMELIHNGTSIGNSSFGVADFNKYINRVMPAGNYELVVTVAGVESEEVDTNATTDPEDPVMVTVYRSGFTESIVFTVDKAPLPSLEKVDAALKGKVFTYTWDGASHLYDSSAAAVVNAYLGASSPSRADTVWADYNNLYGNFAITFNLSRMQSDVYYGANDMTVAAVDPDVYTVYYRISAPNYYSSIENLSGKSVRQDYYFEVVIIREIEVPEVGNVTYTGSSVFPTITPAATGDEEFYEVLWAPDGYLTGGSRTVTFKLRNSDYYCWVGEEVGIEAITVPFKVVAADNAWLRTPNIVGWTYEEFETQVNRIRAVPKFLDEGQSVKFTVTDSDGNVIEGLLEFNVNDDGTIGDQTLITALNGLKSGTYRLEVVVPATNNYNELNSDVEFKIGKAMNAWADGDDDLVLPSWIIGKYDVNENAIVVNPAHGVANIIITDIDGNEYYNSVTGLNKLNDCEVGKYLLKAWVDETADFAALAERTFTIEVFDKVGMPWWGTLLITLGALLIAALIIFILWKKGVFQILTGKLMLAIRNKATVDATIAAIRANKRAEEAKKSVEAAKRRDAAEERKAKAAEERALPAEQRAAALEEKAKKAAERAEKMKARAEAMQMRADRMKENAAAEAASNAEEPAAAAVVEEQPKAEEPAVEAPKAEEPIVEAAATEEPKAEEPVAETTATEEPATEAAAVEEAAPKSNKTTAKKKPSNKK